MKCSKVFVFVFILIFILPACSHAEDLPEPSVLAAAPAGSTDANGQPIDKNGVLTPNAPADINIKPGEVVPPSPARIDLTISPWAENIVKYMIDKQFVPVRLQYNYKQEITREEFADLMVRVVGMKIKVKNNLYVVQLDNKFEDIDELHVNSAFYLGIVNGISETKFEPSRSIARQEAAVMMSNALRSVNVTSLSAEEFGFADKLSVASWAEESVNICANMGIFQGSENGFRPYDKYTREQAIVTVKRFLDNTPDVTSISFRGKVLVNIKDILPTDIVKVGYDYVLFGADGESAGKYLSKVQSSGLKSDTEVKGYAVKLSW